MLIDEAREKTLNNLEDKFINSSINFYILTSYDQLL